MTGRISTDALLLVGALVASGGHASAQQAIACVDPKATLVLTDPDVTGRHPARWRASVARRGRCFTIEAGEQWERVITVGGLILMRKVPPQPGVPPLYFRASSMSEVAAPPPAVQIISPQAATRFDPPPRRASRLKREDVARDAARAGRGRTEILTETLPPPPAAATIPQPALVTPKTPIVAEPPVAAATPPPAPMPPPTPAPSRADLSAASARGYAVGFAMSIVLIVLLLAAAVLLLRRMLRPTPAPVPTGDEMRWREPMLRPVISAPRPAPRRMPQQPLAEALLGAIRPAGPAMAPSDDPSAGPEQENCAAALRETGWEATGNPGSSMIARRRGRVVTVRCLPAGIAVDEHEVEAACLARERERADLTLLVSDAQRTPGARMLALRTGVEILHCAELRAFLA